MDEERAATISPLVDHFRPDLSDTEKQALTTMLRPYFRALYEVFCRMEADGLLDGDSPQSTTNDILGVE